MLCLILRQKLRVAWVRGGRRRPGDDGGRGMRATRAHRPPPLAGTTLACDGSLSNSAPIEKNVAFISFNLCSIVLFIFSSLASCRHHHNASLFRHSHRAIITIMLRFFVTRILPSSPFLSRPARRQPVNAGPSYGPRLRVRRAAGRAGREPVRGRGRATRRRGGGCGPRRWRPPTGAGGLTRTR